jgi:hypothetical protein
LLQQSTHAPDLSNSNGYASVAQSQQQQQQQQRSRKIVASLSILHKHLTSTTPVFRPLTSVSAAAAAAAAVLLHCHYPPQPTVAYTDTARTFLAS